MWRSIKEWEITSFMCVTELTTSSTGLVTRVSTSVAGIPPLISMKIVMFPKLALGINSTGRENNAIKPNIVTPKKIIKIVVGLFIANSTIFILISSVERVKTYFTLFMNYVSK